jgi:hypothetical protein
MARRRRKSRKSKIVCVRTKRGKKVCGTKIAKKRRRRRRSRK